MSVRVILVDDQNLVREGIKSLLQLKPDIHVVAEAIDGEAVMSLLYKHQPDVLLLDIRMPKVSGTDVLQMIKQAGLLVPVLVLTTFDEHQLVLECIKLGAKGYLRKDVSFNELTSAIYSLANGDSWLQPAITSRIDKLANSRADNSKPYSQLTKIEIQVLRLVAAGYSNNEIADALYKSPGTIRNQMSSILTKLDVRDRTRAVVKALELELI